MPGRAALLLLLTLHGLTAGDGPYAGPDACAECHQEQFRKQSRSRHASALKPIPPGTQPAWLQWAFGAGAQGVTPVGVHDGRYFEYRFSEYTRAGKADVTFGHPVKATSEFGM